MKSLDDLRVKIYSDGAELDDFRRMKDDPYIKGFTTNPTLMKMAGVTDYLEFAREILQLVTEKPVSLEVFADEFPEMKRQALKLSALGDNVYVKIPVMNTKDESSIDLVRELTHRGLKLNVTAVMTLEQVKSLAEVLAGGAPSIVSVFAGRIADTGRDPIPVMVEAKRILAAAPKAELLWASPRELLNLFQADEMGCDIITIQPSTLKKLKYVGKDLHEFSRDTVKMFHEDAVASGYTL